MLGTNLGTISVYSMYLPCLPATGQLNPFSSSLRSLVGKRDRWERGRLLQSVKCPQCKGRNCCRRRRRRCCRCSAWLAVLLTCATCVCVFCVFFLFWLRFCCCCCCCFGGFGGVHVDVHVDLSRAIDRSLARSIVVVFVVVGHCLHSPCVCVCEMTFAAAVVLGFFSATKAAILMPPPNPLEPAMDLSQMAINNCGYLAQCSKGEG